MSKGRLCGLFTQSSDLSYRTLPSKVLFSGRERVDNLAAAGFISAVFAVLRVDSCLESRSIGNKDSASMFERLFLKF